VVAVLAFGTLWCGFTSGEAIATQPPEAEEAGFETLLEGDSWSGWEGDRTWFRIHAGQVVAGSLERSIPHNFFLCSKREFEDFELRLDAQLTGPGDNAGIQFRTAKIPGSHEVSGYQADMGSAGERPIWGSLYDESRRRKMLVEADPEAVAEVLNKDGWNRFVIRCEGPRVRIWLNGLLTVDYTEQDPQIARRGIIALQIHGGRPAEARYRRLRIKPL
jgi:hypothetical protein